MVLRAAAAVAAYAIASADFRDGLVNVAVATLYWHCFSSLLTDRTSGHNLALTGTDSGVLAIIPDQTGKV
jgi:hypothetical protein